MLGEKFGHIMDRPLERLARNIPFSPNAISIAGFLLTLISCPILAINLKLGALILLPVSLLDMMDGAVARVQGRTSRFGAFLDSVLDRYSDAAILLAIAWYLFGLEHIAGVALALVALTGSFGISYVRARAEGLGVSCAVGLMERPERLILLFIGAVSGYIIGALWLLAILTHLTVLQRVLHTRRQLK